MEKPSSLRAVGNQVGGLNPLGAAGVDDQLAAHGDGVALEVDIQLAVVVVVLDLGLVQLGLELGPGRSRSRRPDRRRSSGAGDRGQGDRRGEAAQGLGDRGLAVDAVGQGGRSAALE